MVYRNILVTDGVSGLFRGLIPTWCREIPGYFCFFLGYETSRSLGSYPLVSQFLHAYYTIDTEYLIKILNCRSVVASLRQVGPEELRPVETMVCGGMAGVCFWTCIFPLDVIKSRIQVTSHSCVLCACRVYCSCCMI